jgi:N-methylhydantoinase A
LDAAAGVVRVVNHNMSNAIRSRTIQKGRDPRNFSLVAFGGAGPLHAVELARSLRVPEVIVPVYPGITSAMGLLSTDLKYDLIQNEFMLDVEPDLARLNHDFNRLDEEARGQLRSDGVAHEGISVSHAADCRYVGQGYELRVSLPTQELDEELWRRFQADFHRLHEDEYGHAFAGNPIELVNIRVVASGTMPRMPRLPAPKATDLKSALLDRALVHFQSNGGIETVESAFYERSRLPPGAVVDGPAVFVQSDSTLVIPNGARAEVLNTADVMVRVEGS